MEFGAVIGDEFLLGGRSHGDDGGGGWIGDLGGDFPAGKNKAEEVVLVNGHDEELGVFIRASKSPSIIFSH